MIDPGSWHPALLRGARVAVGLSGGVDSSMTAWLLRQAGFDVVVVTMAIWDSALPLPDEGRSGCFGPGERRDIEAAAAFALRLGVPHHVVPLAGEYRETVLEYFKREYRAGRTPNPCVQCNRTVKFGFLLERARSLGIAFDFFATGHYARIDREPSGGRWRLLRAWDRSKDQSYFISGLRQDQLSCLVLPLGSLGKSDVKALAREAGFADLAVRPESQDFIESRHYGVLFGEGEATPGDMVDRRGRVLGRHRGIIHYTIGQRKGLGIGGAGEPYYVTAIEAAANRIVVGRREDLLSREFTVGGCNWIAIAEAPAQPLRVACKIRQRHTAAPAILARAAENDARVTFDEPQMSITPGQTAVFYDGDVVVGSGTIERASLPEAAQDGITG